MRDDNSAVGGREALPKGAEVLAASLEYQPVLQNTLVFLAQGCD